jgi:hypothetical protein
MLTDAERAELRALSERAYTKSTDRPLSDAEAARLQSLEQRRTSADHDAEADTVDVDQGESPPHDASAPPRPSPDDAPPTASGARIRWIRPTVAVIAVLGAAGVGWLAGASQSSLPAESAQPPELLRAATDEDHVNAPDLAIDPESTRFIARLNQVDVYLAVGTEPDTVCLVTFSPAVGPSAGCGGWSPHTGGVSVSIGDDLNVAIGPVLPAGRAPGSAFALSETVFAIRTR